MSKQVLFINAEREGYDINQVPGTMHVGELISFLQDFDEDMPVYLNHDNGYTFGGLREEFFHDEVIYEDEEE